MSSNQLNNFNKPASLLSLLLSGAFLISGLLLLIFSSAKLALIFFFLPILAYLIFLKPNWFIFSFLITRVITDFFPNQYAFVFFDIFFSLTISQLLGIIFFVFGLFWLALNKRLIKYNRLQLAWIVIIIWGLFTALYSINTASTFQELLRISDIFILFLFSSIVFDSLKKFNNLLLAILFSSFIPLLVGFYQFIFKITYQYEGDFIPRIFGTFSHPNIFSLFLFLIVAFGFLRLKIASKNETFIICSYLFLITIFIALILTYTRIAWIAVFIFFFIIGAFQFKKLIIPLMIIPIMLFFSLPSLQERIYDTVQISPSGSIAWRLNLWTDTYSKTISENRQLSGYGLGTFNQVAEDLRGIRFGANNDPHNDYLKFFVEGGAMGLLVFIFYIFSSLIFFFKNYLATKEKQSKITYLVLFSIFLSLSIASLSDNVFRNTPLQFIFWTVAGATIGTFYKKNKAGVSHSHIVQN